MLGFVISLVSIIISFWFSRRQATLTSKRITDISERARGDVKHRTVLDDPTFTRDLVSHAINSAAILPSAIATLLAYMNVGIISSSVSWLAVLLAVVLCLAAVSLQDPIWAGRLKLRSGLSLPTVVIAFANILGIILLVVFR